MELTNPIPSSADNGRPNGVTSAHRLSDDDVPPNELRNALDRSERGAPAAGETLRDLFSTDEIFHRLVTAAAEEFSRSTRLLFLSGLAAGLSISLSFLGMAALSALWPGGPSRLAGSLMYPLGFLLVVMGRYQLFTENTLTPVALVLTRIASLPRLLYIWSVVLAANVLGAGLVAYVLAASGVFSSEMAAVASRIGAHFLDMPWDDVFWKGVFAGWLVASMVWLNYAARDTTARTLITFTLIYPVAAAGLAHCVVGSTEVLYVVFRGEASVGAFITGFLVPAVLGNTAGGVLLVAILNFSQTRDRRFSHRGCGQLELTWTEWLFGHTAGAPLMQRDDTVRLDPTVQPRDHTLGPDDAPVTVVQYGDYSCPTSRRIYRTVQQVRYALRMENGGEAIPFQYAFRHLPLRQRPVHSVRAAVASEAAARQRMFWAMHEQLFAHRNHLTNEDLRAYAASVGLDLEQFEDDLGDECLHRRVMSDRQSAIESGVRQSSNLFIDGTRYRGDLQPQALIQAVRRQVAVIRASRCGETQCCPLPLDHPASSYNTDDIDGRLTEM
ncbi:formate/nitrite transporter family protein [Salinibacter sp.]|uniref:formate/nitrite transporter family protein n=1 Tax=Salinibacter sp. TaxID=2065818 RepID=UPI0021E8C696|nr:formate/nitrite transporter family protein [Salinibacter sp.]